MKTIIPNYVKYTMYNKPLFYCYLQVRSSVGAEYTVLCTGRDIVRTERPSKMHIIQHIPVPASRLQQQRTARYVRLLIHRPATRYGASIWRLQVWGRAASVA